MCRPLRFHLLLLLVLLLPAALAQTVPAGRDQAGSEQERPPEVPETLRSPRATLATFLHAMNDIKRGKPERIDDAVATLDLSDVSTLVRRERGRDLAWMLLEVMDRTRRVDLKRVPDRREGPPYLFHRYASGAITIARMKDGRWLFDAATVAALPAIMDELSSRSRVAGVSDSSDFLPWYLRLRQQMPERLRGKVLTLEGWQWLGLLLTIAVGVLVDRLLALLLRLSIRRWKRRTSHPEYRNVDDNVLRPLGLMAMAVIWWLGLNMLGLPESALLVLLVAVKFLASLSGVWAAYRLVDLVTARMLRRAEESEGKLDDALVPLVPKTLKIFVTVAGFVFIANNLNLDVTGLLAGLGLGGLAFALAGKDLVQNLFGSITVLMDRTFTVGDWIIVGDVEGTVERIGFRSTRIRTFYNSLVTVPNSRFITASVDNMGARRYRRLSCKLSLTYDTPPDRIEAFCEGIRELVRRHPYMRKDYYQVYLNEFAASSLDVLLYVFWATPDWNTELRERHRLLLDILRLAQRLGVEFAFPTQTIYMKSEEAAEVPAEELPQERAFELGREAASKIVDETLGRGVRPPPVRFPQVD
ncbi:MAG TPA: mechanosensitive ion channel family protein [Sedimenticola thiotaurini]|uniref:Mechanosensitive ion channel family protein n=1 Tax=Sedimenticola thiotaurini TaxID=1543721 RepID=A0A831W2R5_9GAMM|nr:mechanosensitive ion channel family protein [Sedimenticola thiotaurini]